jgi:hypothetical protein
MDSLYAKCKHVTLFSRSFFIFSDLFYPFHLVFLSTAFALADNWCLVMKVPGVSLTVLWLSLKNWDRSIVWPWGVLIPNSLRYCLLLFFFLFFFFFFMLHLFQCFFLRKCFNVFLTWCLLFILHWYTCWLCIPMSVFGTSITFIVNTYVCIWYTSITQSPHENPSRCGVSPASLPRSLLDRSGRVGFKLLRVH